MVTPLGNVMYHQQTVHEVLDEGVIWQAVSECLTMWPNIGQIIVGTPSIADEGVIRHCDLPELNDLAIVNQLSMQFERPVHLENDMHLKAYGYYKNCGSEEEVITLAYFPEGIVPGTASIHAGTIIKGKNQLAGMIAFLPYGVSWKEQLALLKRPTCMPLIIQAVTSLIAIINPGVILFSGELVDEAALQTIRKECLKVIPEIYMPVMRYQSDLEAFYLSGMYQKALQLKSQL